MLKKEHKFFEVFVDNNLTTLYTFLTSLHKKIIDENLLNLSDNIMRQYKEEPSGAVTKLGDKYNIFSMSNIEIVRLYDALVKLTKEACEYYEINFEEQKYMIHGWFNLDFSNEGNKGAISPLNHPYHFHDHSEGRGIPYFHGYYCVNAEPSTTYYKIGGKDGKLFNNINTNNRAIVSETGHPHGRDDWYEEKHRITIAYDIAPLEDTFFDITKDKVYVPWIPLR